MRAILETERLLLRPMELSDAEAMFRNWASDPEVTKYLMWNPHPDISMTEYVLGRFEAEYKDPKTVRFGIVEKKSGELFGCIDVVRYVGDIPELGYCSSRRFWGNGYMTEAAGKVIEYLKEIGHKKVIISAQVENIASNRVIQKLGLVFKRQEEMTLTLKNNKVVTVNIYEKTL